LNAIFTRVVIAEPAEGGGLWVLGLSLSFFTPLGLPLGYIVARKLPIASLQRVPFLRHRLTWLLLFATSGLRAIRLSLVVAGGDWGLRDLLGFEADIRESVSLRL
jgi:Na+-driven multidrug efflux pump